MNTNLGRVPDGTGLSQAEPEGSLGPSGFDPSRYRMSDELRDLLDRARHHKMMPEEVFEQRVSFVYGMQDFDNPNPKSKDEIRAMLVEMNGRPPCPVCQRDLTPKRMEAVARAIASNKRGLAPDDPEVDRTWNSYVGQARAAVAAAFRDSDGSPEGRDREDGLDGEAATARAEGIAQKPPLPPHP